MIKILEGFVILSKLIRFGVISIALITVFLSAANAQDQKDVSDPDLNMEMEFGTVVSEEGELPFWLHSNRWGSIDRNSANGFIRLAPQVDFGTFGPIKLSAGAELIGRLSEGNTVFFNEGYLQVDWQILRLVAGRKKEQIGITDSSLTSGSMIQSANASPIPKLQISTSDFVEIPGTDDWVSFKGYFAHGWMEENRVASRAYLQQKYLYLRLFREESPFNAYAGFSQSTIWAGNHPQHGELPDGFRNFIRVLLSKNIDEDDPNYPDNETGGTLGNTTAGYDTGIKMKFNFADVMLHRLFYLEDRPGLWFRSPLDGIWGLSVDFNDELTLIDKVIWEHLNTTKQGSKSFERRGADNYYNNSIYNSGWSYQNRTVGSPFLFTKPGMVGIQNNIVVMHNLGIEGKWSKVGSYKFLASYSRNYGANWVTTDLESLGRQSGRTDRKDQYSFLLQTSMKLTTNIDFNVDLAYDTGDLYADQLGGMVSIVYRLR